MLARQRRAAVRQKGFGKAVIATQPLHLILPELCDSRAHQKPVARVADGGLEKHLEGQTAETLVERDPGRHRAGNGNGVPSGIGHCREAGEAFGGPCRRGAAGRVEAVQSTSVPDDREGVAADSVHHRFDDGERDGGRHSRVDRAAAPGEHGEARLRGKRLGRGHAIGRKQRHAKRRVGKLPFHPVGLMTLEKELLRVAAGHGVSIARNCAGKR